MVTQTGGWLILEIRAREDRALRAIVLTLGEAYGFGRVATIAREVWAEREPDFEKTCRKIGGQVAQAEEAALALQASPPAGDAGETGKKTAGGTLAGNTEGGPT